MAKNRAATMPMTTQDTAVGKEVDGAEEAPPETRSLRMAAIASGIDDGHRHGESSRRALFSITRQKIGLVSSFQ